MAQYDTVPFTNYSDVNFSFSHDKEDYFVKAGETKYYPEFIALHGAKHLIDRELIRAGKIKQLNNLEERNKLAKKILGSLVKVVKNPLVDKEVNNELSEAGQEIDEQLEKHKEVEEEFPDLAKLDQGVSMTEKQLVDMTRGELFSKIKQLGVKGIRATVSNSELRKIIATV